MTVENVTLSNGIKMPLEGFGVFQVPDAAVCKQAVLDAISVGNRLIDTAAIYMNEEAVGDAVEEAIDTGLVKREELFITTKLWPSDMSYEGAKVAFERSLKKLKLDYLDMFMLHQPYGDVYGAWKAMVELYNEGKIKALGVANFSIGKFTEFAEIVDVKPHVNQIELHPFFFAVCRHRKHEGLRHRPAGMGAARRRQTWYFHAPAPECHWRKVRQDRRPGGPQVECPARGFHYSEIRS